MWDSVCLRHNSLMVDGSVFVWVIWSWCLPRWPDVARSSHSSYHQRWSRYSSGTHTTFAKFTLWNSAWFRFPWVPPIPYHPIQGFIFHILRNNWQKKTSFLPIQENDLWKFLSVFDYDLMDMNQTKAEVKSNKTIKLHPWYTSDWSSSQLSSV